jgi:hypothetical protein
VQPRGLFDAPNAVIEVEGNCASKPNLRARVRNVGLASLPAGVVIGFYSGDPSAPTKLGTGTTKAPITPGGFEIVDFEWDSPPGGYFTGAVGVFGKVADDGTPTSVHQCKTDDDTSKLFKNKCTG